MRFSWAIAAFVCLTSSCAVDKGPSACIEGMQVDCDCPSGAVRQQTCVGGVFTACACDANAGSGGAAGLAGTGGVAGFAGTGGAGGVAGVAGTGDSGTGGVGGTSGAGGSAGTGGVAGTSGSGGTSGAGGSGGTGGTSGTGGTGGTAGGGAALWSRCDVNNGNADCETGLVCYRAAGLSPTGPGFCTNECASSDECKQVEGAVVTASCGSEGVCRFTCLAAGCPFGMTCSFAGRCNYQ